MKTHRGRGMQYKGLEITAFEQEPGKWRARIVAANRQPLKGDERQLLETLTNANLSSPVDVLTSAMQAVDAKREAGGVISAGKRSDFGECFVGRLATTAPFPLPRRSPDEDVWRSRRPLIFSGQRKLPADKIPASPRRIIELASTR